MKPTASQIDAVLRRRFFIAPTATIYGGVSGLFDYGPLGVLLKSNIISLWRKHFVKSNIYEVDTCIITPYDVLKASGHVDKFADLLVFDQVNGECYRADHLLEAELGKLLPNPDVSQILAKIDSLTPDEINDILLRYDIRSVLGNRVGGCTPFNLIFKTQVGAKARSQAFLRPETAQGQFINFKKLYEIAGEKLPFGSFSIGRVFRNEISPRGGLLRVREFEQAEIEYYVHPLEKECKAFYELPEMEISMHYQVKTEQETVKMSLRKAVKQGIVDNETIGYFIGVTFSFLMECGIKPDYLRFRQHRKDEMAHYASDCWDAEILTSFGWVECVGIADRGCYDLSMHQQASGVSMKAQRALDKPIIENKWVLLPDKQLLGRELKQELPEFLEIIDNMSQDYILENIRSEDYLMVPFNQTEYKIIAKKIESKVSVEEFMPTVIEPSFGIGRIMYALIECCFYQREDDQNRCVMAFNPSIAPIKCVVSMLLNKDVPSKSIVNTILRDLKDENIESRFCDRSISIGRKYASNDEIGVPFFITVDGDSIKDYKVTIRERDLMDQIRVSVNDVPNIIKNLIRGKTTFDEYSK